MIIDMSQTVVNRTAMYHISHHVYGVLEPIRSGSQFFGRTFDAAPAQADLKIMQKAAFAAVLSDPTEFTRRDAATGPGETRPTLYLDPLYVLFGNLTADDTVFILDLSTVTTPSWHASGVSRAYDEAFNLICARQPRVIAISRNTADTLYANYGYPRDLTQVLPLYVPKHLTDDVGFDPFYSPEPFVLFVGSLEWRKNVVGAIESFRLSGLGHRGYRLIIAGGAGHRDDEIRTFAQTVHGVFFTGYVSDQELRAIYGAASAFIYPSYLEGFGVPLLEAMNSAIPSVASNTGACPEVGGDLMRYYDPDDHVGFAQELVHLVGLDDAQRESYAEAARRRVREHFSIERFDAGLRAIFGLTA